ncbi:hypothetical protein JTB14_034776 [Gonioctena quinquepunctata]|nr:hypothetical protein JTB14_034776 [Gonioctena quinquepunctata]
MSELRQPGIKIVGYTQEHTQEKIENCMKKQNDLRGEIKVNSLRKNRNDTKTIFCEAAPNVFHQILNLKKLCLGWERLMVSEDLSVPKCFNCRGYYHKKQECTQK